MGVEQWKGSACVDLDVVRDAAGLSMTARGSGGKEASAKAGPSVFAKLDAFVKAVRRAAETAALLDAEGRAVAQELWEAILGGAVGNLLASEAQPGAPCLVRLSLDDRAADTHTSLHEVPFEALLEPRKQLGFFGISSDVCLVRRVSAQQNRANPRDVLEALRVLAIEPLGQGSTASLSHTLAERIACGEMEMAGSVDGELAKARHLPRALEIAQDAHIVHFLGHGGVLRRNGMPVLFTEGLAAQDAEDTIPIELFAELLKKRFPQLLRLLVLECCEGARRGEVGSAGELIVHAGVDAVLGHLYPVRSDFARRFSQVFYRHLCADGGGNVASAIQAARLDTLTELQTMEALGPVMYVRSTVAGAQTFDFALRKRAPSASFSASKGSKAGASVEALWKVLDQPFSLLLGDALPELLPSVERFRADLGERLSSLPVSEWNGPKDQALPLGLPTSAAAQHFALRHSRSDLVTLYEPQAESASDPVRPLLHLLAAHLREGVHVSLLHNPVLEEALLERRPGLALDVIRPRDPLSASSSALLSRYADGKFRGKLFQETRLDLLRSWIVLRLLSGHLPTKQTASPWLTEDEHWHGLQELRAMLPDDVGTKLQRALGERPVLCVGLSLRRQYHRMVLHRVLGGLPFPKGSLVVVDPASEEAPLWENGAGLPGGVRVAIANLSTAELEEALRAGEGR